MRKKQVATRYSVEYTTPLELLSDTTKDSISECVLDINKIAELSYDANGNGTLADGTPVVQPTCADYDEGCTVQFDFKDGMLPKNKQLFPDGCPGGLDTVKCTVCGISICPFVVACEVHPQLKVIICKRCSKFYGKGEFAKDEDGKDENCRWCGDGGDLICCDSCSNAFCKSCIKKNLGRTFIHDIEQLSDNELWHCLVCQIEPLLPLQQLCSEVMERVKANSSSLKKRSIRAQGSLRSRNVQNLNNPLGKSNLKDQSSNPVLNPKQLTEIETLAAVLSSYGTNIFSPTGNIVDTSEFFKPGCNNLSNAQQHQCFTQKNVSIENVSQALAVSNSKTLFDVTAKNDCSELACLSSTTNDNQKTYSIVGSSEIRKNKLNQQKNLLPFNNTNTDDWYLKNATVAGILNQISCIQPSNISIIMKQLRVCLETFVCDIRRVETNFHKAKTEEEMISIVRSFQSIFRFHYLNRIGNVVFRIQEEDQICEPNISKSSISKTQIYEPSTGTRCNSRVMRPILSEPLTIDLTDDSETGIAIVSSSQVSSSPNTHKSNFSDNKSNLTNANDFLLNGKYSTSHKINKKRSNNNIETSPDVINTCNSPVSDIPASQSKRPKRSCSAAKRFKSNSIDKENVSSNQPVSSKNSSIHKFPQSVKSNVIDLIEPAANETAELQIKLLNNLDLENIYSDKQEKRDAICDESVRSETPTTLTLNFKSLVEKNSDNGSENCSNQAVPIDSYSSSLCNSTNITERIFDSSNIEKDLNVNESNSKVLSNITPEHSIADHFTESQNGQPTEVPPSCQ